MEKFVIIGIEDNHLNPDGHALIVKANPVEDAPGFEYLSEMFGKKYSTYTTTETSNTEIFIFPYSEELLERLLSITRKDDDEKFWEPDMYLFYDSRLQLRDGKIKRIHKSIEFQKKNMSHKPSKKSLTFIPPVADWQFRHKKIMECECIVYPATLTDVKEKPDGGFSWDSGEIAFFVFPDDNYYNMMLTEAISLDPWKKEFWKPNLNDFYNYQISQQGPFGKTTHNLYISRDLPTEMLIKNIEQLLN